MNFWPFRSRPVATPFDLPFSAKVIRYPNTYNTQIVSLSIPDNIFIVPSTICFVSTNAAGVRSTVSSTLHIYRGDQVFSAAIFARLVSSVTQQHFLQANSPTSAAMVPNTVLNFPLPFPLFLYPEDRLDFNLYSFVPGDVFSGFTIHGRTWETF